ncbi:MAG: phosphoribosylanthranilate isomerase [Oscillospiraceae bacterium]|nr:phosphoribosylanthranilate isomerase [Oscillospiraceae bacterium]
MNTKVKICGLTRIEDIHYVNDAKPDYIGFVFAESRRKVTPQKALELRGKLSVDIIPVGVFVNEPIENVISLVENAVIDMIQLHGSENAEYINRIKSLTDKPIIKANADRNTALLADYLLFDNIVPGSGKCFDWDTLRGDGRPQKPFFLAGGLGIDNIQEAITKLNPFVADTSSGVETNGIKDCFKIKEFIQKARLQKGQG